MSEGSSCSDHWPRPTFGVVREGGGRFNLLKLAPLLEDIHERLAGVVIECLPWRAFIMSLRPARHALLPGPALLGSEKDYGAGAFGREQFAEMAEVLKGLQGAFIVSLNAVPGVFEAFEAFSIEEVDCTYTVGGRGHSKVVKEVIISPGD